MIYLWRSAGACLPPTSSAFVESCKEAVGHRVGRPKSRFCCGKLHVQRTIGLIRWHGICAIIREGGIGILQSGTRLAFDGNVGHKYSEVQGHHKTDFYSRYQQMEYIAKGHAQAFRSMLRFRAADLRQISVSSLQILNSNIGQQRS